MEIKYLNRNSIVIAFLENGVIASTADALDLIATASYNDAAAIVIPMEWLTPDFFSLKTGLAGEILQKFVNYRMRAAIVGDFSAFNSKSLAAFIRESNKGRHVFFKNSLDEAVSLLANL